MIRNDPYVVLIERIREGAYPVGARLPSERSLAEEFGVHRTTIQRMITRLSAEGFVNRQRGCRPVVRGGPELPVKMGVIAVLVDAGFPIVDNGFGSLLLGAQAILRSEGYRVLFLSPSVNGRAARFRTEHEEIRSLLSDPVDGVIYVAEDPVGSAPLIRGLLDSGTAVVAADRLVTGVRTDYVGVDNAGGATTATEHLLALGHERIAFADTPQNRYEPAEERKQAFLETLSRHGMSTEADAVMDLPSSSDVVRNSQFLNDWLKRHPMPTGIVCVHDGVAFSLARSLAAMGCTVPRDVSIVGFDDDAEKRNLGDVELTTVRQPFFHVGEDAANLLVSRLRRPETPLRSVRLSPTLIVRSSTRPPSNP